MSASERTTVKTGRQSQGGVLGGRVARRMESMLRLAVERRLVFVERYRNGSGSRGGSE